MTLIQRPITTRREASIRRRLIVLLALAILPVGLISILAAFYNYERQRQDFTRDVNLMARFVASERGIQLSGARGVLAAIASRFDVGAATKPQCVDGLRRTLQSFPNYEGLGYLDRRGDLVCATETPSGGRNASQAPWFKSAIGGQTLALGRVSSDGATAQDRVFLAVPVRGPDAQVEGVLGVTITIKKLNAAHKSLQDVDAAHSAVLTPTGDIFAASGARTDEWLPSTKSLQERLRNKVLAFTQTSESGARYMYVMQPIAGDGAVSILAVRMDDRVRSIWLNFVGVAALPMLMWLAAIAAAWFGIDRLVIRPLLRLRSATRGYTSGDFKYRPSVSEKVALEFRDLSADFNTMANAIQERTAALEASLEQNQSLVREIHHRVKNNLQLIASIISTRARATDREEENELLSEIGNRVRALAIVHAEFRGPEQAMAVDLAQVLRTIVSQHQATFGDDDHAVQLTVGDGCWVDIDLAVPTALLVSEVLTATREQSDETQCGKAVISMEPPGAGRAVLAIEIVLPKAGRLSEPNSSVSARLIDALARQLHASVDKAASDRLRIVVDLVVAEPIVTIE